MKCLLGTMGCLVVCLALGCDSGDVDLEPVPPGGAAPMEHSDPAAPNPHLDPTPSVAPTPSVDPMPLPNTTAPAPTGPSDATPEEAERTVAPAVTEEPVSDLPNE